MEIIGYHAVKVISVCLNMGIEFDSFGPKMSMFWLLEFAILACKMGNKVGRENHIFKQLIWEKVAQDRAALRHGVKEGAYRAEETIRTHAARKCAARKERATSTREASTYICVNCNRDCHSRIGLHSHSRRYANPPQR